MGKKLFWFKQYSEGWIADLHIRSLTCSERGMLGDINCILRTQSIEPGVFVFKGFEMDCKLVKKDGEWILPEKPTEGFERVMKWLCSCLGWDLRRAYSRLARVMERGLLTSTPNGYLQWPSIVKEYAESEVKAEAGRARGAKDSDSAQQGAEQSAQQGVEVEEEEEKEEEGCSTVFGGNPIDELPDFANDGG